MRLALIGASPLGIATAHALIERGHDVIIIDRDRAKIDQLSQTTDCGFIHGDGTRPQILREVGPKETAILFCLTDNDQSNILASLVGRSLGFARVVTKIEDAEFEHICIELGLADILVPDRHVAETLASMTAGESSVDYSTYFKGPVRLFSFIARPEDAGPAGELDLPERTRVLFAYRGEELRLADAETEIAEDDEVVLITHDKALGALRERWAPRTGEEKEPGRGA